MNGYFVVRRYILLTLFMCQITLVFLLMLRFFLGKQQDPGGIKCAIKSFVVKKPCLSKTRWGVTRNSRDLLHVDVHRKKIH